MQDLFAALRAHDLQRFQEITGPDFYAYDAGLRFTGPAFMELLDKAQASGKHHEWSVTNPEVHVACNLAWITYVNQGAVEDSSGRQAVTWLESGILGYANGQWRIRFAHSTRAPIAP
jgi:ketosteroid isomerase-like protein